jgi:hypothetical protein
MELQRPRKAKANSGAEQNQQEPFFCAKRNTNLITAKQEDFC